MINLFITLIIIFAFVCILTVFIGIKSDKILYPVISVCCGVMIIAFALCCAIEAESYRTDNIKETSTKAYISVSQNTEKALKKSDNVSKSTAVTEEKSSIEETSETTTERSKTQTVKGSSDDKGRTVYITKTGTKYHYSYFCSNTDFYECTLQQALDRGLEPCKRCVE